MTFFSEDAAILLEFSVRYSENLGAMDEIINAMVAVITKNEINEGRGLSEGRNMIKARPSEQEHDYIRAAEGLAPEAKWGIVARGVRHIPYLISRFPDRVSPREHPPRIGSG